MFKHLLSSIALLAGAAQFASASTIDELYVFGDSLNDCCVNDDAPFTNGDETWLVEFAESIGAVYEESTKYNYATGGAQSGPNNAIAPGGVPVANGLQSQIAQFLSDAPVVDSHDMAVIWAGTNDIWASSYLGDTLFGLSALDIVKPLGQNPGTQELAEYIADNIRTSIVALQDYGFGNALVVTPYDIGNSGLVDDLANGAANNSAYSKAVVAELKSLLASGSGTSILDAVGVIEELQANSPGNGFTQLTAADACTVPGVIDCTERSSFEQDSYIFLDFVHLTEAANSEIAKAAAELVKDGDSVSAVPLPAGGWLLVTMLAGSFVIGRRRQMAKS